MSLCPINENTVTILLAQMTQLTPNPGLRLNKLLAIEALYFKISC